MNLRKKYGFELKFTYWDCDDLHFQMKSDGMDSFVLKREEGDIIITSDLKFRHPEIFTIRVDQLIEVFLSPVEHVKAMMKVHKEFSDIGPVKLGELSSPGLDDMLSWCRAMDKVIVEAAYELKRHKIHEIFNKIWIEMGGESIKGEDRVAKRLLYFRDLGAAYRGDEYKWLPEMKRIGLIK